MRTNMTEYARDDVAALIRAVLAFGRRLRSERASGGVTSSAASMLNTLHMLGPMSARQLASEERLQPQSLTRIVKRQGKPDSEVLMDCRFVPLVTDAK